MIGAGHDVADEAKARGERDAAGRGQGDAAGCGERDAAGRVDRDEAEIERRILQAVRSLEFGTVEITVHDARVVQIERREKMRFERPPADRPGHPGERRGRPLRSRP